MKLCYFWSTCNCTEINTTKSITSCTIWTGRFKDCKIVRSNYMIIVLFRDKLVNGTLKLNCLNRYNNDYWELCMQLPELLLKNIRQLSLNRCDKMVTYIISLKSNYKITMVVINPKWEIQIFQQPYDTGHWLGPAATEVVMLLGTATLTGKAWMAAASFFAFFLEREHSPHLGGLGGFSLYLIK